MSNKNLVIDLHTKTDRLGQKYYIGKLKCPITIDCKDGIAFILFTSSEGNEVLQIAPMDSKEKENDEQY